MPIHADSAEQIEMVMLAETFNNLNPDYLNEIFPKFSLDYVMGSDKNPTAVYSYPEERVSLQVSPSQNEISMTVRLPEGERIVYNLYGTSRLDSIHAQRYRLTPLWGEEGMLTDGRQYRIDFRYSLGEWAKSTDTSFVKGSFKTNTRISESGTFSYKEEPIRRLESFTALATDKVNKTLREGQFRQPGSQGKRNR